MNPSKIWQCLASPELGGGELVALKLAAGLSEMIGQSGVLVPGRGPAQQEAEKMGLLFDQYPLQICSSKSVLQAFVGNLATFLKMRKLTPDILHFHSPFAYRAVNRAVGLLRNVKTIAHVHLEYEKSGLTWALQYPPDVIVVCAQFLESYVRECLPAGLRASQRIEVLSNAVDLNKFYPGDKSAARNELGWDLDTPVVLMVADLAPHKGQKTALLAIEQLKKTGKNVRCFLVGRARAGSEAYENELHQMVRDLDLDDQVFFAGQRDDVPLLMRAADCLVLPSTREGLPLCILEAQASGLPVVAAPTSGVPEVVVDEESGFLVKADDYMTYSRKISLLISNIELSNKFKNSALSHVVNKRSFDSYIREALSIYDNIL